MEPRAEPSDSRPGDSSEDTAVDGLLKPGAAGVAMLSFQWMKARAIWAALVGGSHDPVPATAAGLFFECGAMFGWAFHADRSVAEMREQGKGESGGRAEIRSNPV